MVIERRDFLSFVHGEPKVAMKLIELQCARLAVAGARMGKWFFSICRRLLEENAAAVDKNKLSITQQEISGILGMTRESVNTHLQIWARRGVIALKRGTILVLVPQALAALVSGDDGNDWGGAAGNAKAAWRAIVAADGKPTEWQSKALRTYQRRTVAADAVIAGSYLGGANTPVG